MQILCTNDDGYLSRGLRMLADTAREFGDVHVVAPDREQSASSHALTMHFPLRVHRTPQGSLKVDGTPTDCVALAVGTLLETRPDFVLSGINHGPNMGEDVLYSGTVAAAMEATILGVPAMAVSYVGDDEDLMEELAPIVRDLVRRVLTREDFPAETLLNVNLPAVSEKAVRGVRVTRLARRVYTDSLTSALDPSGRPYFWIGGGGVEWSAPEGSDFRAVDEGYVSVTPLHLDLTNHRLLSEVEGWGLDR